MRSKLKFVILLIFLFLSTRIHAVVDPSQPDAGHLQLLLKKLTVVGNVLYIAAHPDDENTSALAYFSWGKLLRTAYLSLNRGEGGQNLIGSEQGDFLGVIRTQELLGARSVDHAEQFFTRAVDFGFSKSPDESFEKWGGKEEILSDVVWIVRKFHPDVMVTRFPVEGGGHGHHTASALLAQEAFTAAGDPSRFPDQLKYVAPWKPKRLVWNRYSWGGQPQLTDAEKQTMPHLDFGEYNYALGKSYTEIAALASDHHKSQGWGDLEERGPHVEYFRHSAGDPSTHDLFDGIDFSWKRVPGGTPIGAALELAYRNFKPEDPSASIPALLKAYALMKQHTDNPWIAEKIEEVKSAIQACAGLWLEAIADDYSAVPGSQVKVKLTAINRSKIPIKLKPDVALRFNEPYSQDQMMSVPSDQPYSQPYWLQSTPDRPFAVVNDQQLIGLPDSPPALQTEFHVLFGNEELTYKIPVLYRWVNPVQGERYRNMVIVPEVALNLKEKVLMFPDATAKRVSIELVSGMPKAAGQIRLQLPNGWSSDPASIPFQFEKKNETQTVAFRITPGANAASGSFSAQAVIGQKQIDRGILTIDYPHIPPQTLFPLSHGKLVRLELKRTGQNLGYIVGSGDQMPETLTEIGYRVTLLSDGDIANADLSRYDAIIVGIRAYNTRPSLKNLQPRLMDYVKNDGTLVTQYNTLQDLSLDTPGPYPFHISRDRVSVEEAPITILKPEHPLLNFPNKITQADFAGWIQERGLYFPDQWDSHYETIIACNDPGEPSKAGGILYAHFGKGVFIYTGYSWFRELPAGVSGAYRLFVNLLSAKGSQ